jgi:hypothetical protein
MRDEALKGAIGAEYQKSPWDEKGISMPPPAAPVDWKAEYLKSVESGCITLDELREARAELDATNRQVEILSDALAESRREIDALVALARADEREACAKVCDELSPPCGYNLTETSFWDVTSLECAAAIRARSKNDPM